jgi:hypothetical protein
MNMNLVAIAGVPPAADMSGKLIGAGGCGCSAFGETPPTDEQRAALNWTAIGFFGVAIAIGYFMLREPTGRRAR